MQSIDTYEPAELDETLDAALDDAPALDDGERLSFKPALALTPRSYQQEALAAWEQADGRAVVVLPTGAGKTVLALMALTRLRLRTLIVVPTIELLHQWRAAVIERLGVAEEHVGVVGDGRRELRPITIITYASAAMPHAKLAGYGLLICDEAHHLPAPAYRTLVARCGAAHTLGLTATPGDERAALIELLGPVVYERTPEALSADGHLAQFRRKRLAVELSDDEALRYGVLMSEWKWFLARNRATLGGRGDFFGELIRRSGSDPAARAALRAHHQARMIALNAEAKLGVVARLLDQHRGDKVIIFSEYNLLVDQISAALALPALTYKTAPSERAAILRRFRDGSYSKLVAGRVLNEGVDVPDAQVAIVVSGNSTPREQIQRLGRVIRPKPGVALLYEIVTRHTAEVGASLRRSRGIGG